MMIPKLVTARGRAMFISVSLALIVSVGNTAFAFAREQSPAKMQEATEGSRFRGAKPTLDFKVGRMLFHIPRDYRPVQTTPEFIRLSAVLPSLVPLNDRNAEWNSQRQIVNDLTIIIGTSSPGFIDVQKFDRDVVVGFWRHQEGLVNGLEEYLHEKSSTMRIYRWRGNSLEGATQRFIVCSDSPITSVECSSSFRYGTDVVLRVRFAKRYLKDWTKIHERVIQLVRSFEESAK